MIGKGTPAVRVVSVLTIVAILLASAANPTMSSHAASPYNPIECPAKPGQGPQGRALILMQGMFSRSVSEPMWDKLTHELSDLYGGFIYYSYSGRPHDYGASDTFESIATHDVPLLWQLISSCRMQGWTSFDLIGHSKGGVVALEYVKVYGFTGSQAGLVRNVVTLDAPVNGSELAWLLIHSPGPESPAPSWWGLDLVGGEAVAELSQMHENREDVSRLNMETAAQLEQAGGCLLTLTNNQDVAIARADAIVEGFGKSYDLGTNIRGDLGRRLGHHLTLDVPNETTELQDIRGCLSGQLPARSLPSQEQPGLRESFVSFVNNAARQVGQLLSNLWL